jgi:hypothetical protein
MSMSRQIGDRSVFDRTHGPAVGASGDGLEGAYSAILNSAPSAGTVKVIVPNLWGLTTARVAVCPPTLTGHPGDRVLVVFDEEKQPWVAGNLATPITGADWIAPSLINSWVVVGAVGYLKDPLGFVHLRGQVSDGTSGAIAFVLPAGYRPGIQSFFPSVVGGGFFGYTGITNAGWVTPETVGQPTTSGLYLDGITFLAEY